MAGTCHYNNIPTSFLFAFIGSVSSVASRQHLRSASRGLLVVPRHRLSSYGRWLFLWPALRYGTGYHTVWEIRLSAEIPSSVHWRRFYFQLTRVHSALELSGRCTLQIYLLTYYRNWGRLQKIFLAHRVSADAFVSVCVCVRHVLSSCCRPVPTTWPTCFQLCLSPWNRDDNIAKEYGKSRLETTGSRSVSGEKVCSVS